MFHRANKGSIKPQSMNDSKKKFKARKVKRGETQNTGMDQTAVRRYAGSQEEILAPNHSSNENSTAPHAVRQEIEKQETKETRAMNNPDSQSKNPSQQDNQAGAPSQARVDIPGNNFQRPGMPAQGSRPAYPANYPGATAPSAAAASSSAPSYSGASSSESAAGRQLILGQGITMSGEIESCDHLIVEGTIEATLKGANRMDIAETGSFFGTVEIEDANISGRFEGDITVKGRLTIESTGVIIGTIAYKELSMEAGATLDGSISPIGSTNAAAQGGSNKKAAAPAKAKKVMQNSGAELPFSEQAVAAE